MLKNFCFCPAQYCSTTSQTSFNYHTLKGTTAAAVSSTLQRHLDRSSGPILDAAVGFKNDRAAIGRFTIERSCSSSCRSNSIDAGEDSGGGAFTFLSSSTTATTTTAATTANNSIHFYHPKSIQTNSPTTSSSSSSSSSTSCSRETTDDDVVNPGGSNSNNKKQENNCNVAVDVVSSKSSAIHGLVSNLTPLSESIRVQIQQRSQSNSNNNTTTNNNNSNTSSNLNNQNNKENVRSTSRTTNSRLVTSTAVINLKPSPPITQPPSLDGE